MKNRETAILELIQYKSVTQGFNDDMRLVGEAMAIRAFKAGASAYRAVTQGMAAAHKLTAVANHTEESPFH